MALFAVFYTYVTDSARLDQARGRHRAHLGALHRAGVVLASGPLGGDAPPDALLVVAAPDAEAALAALEADPFWVEGLIRERAARPWTQVYGPFPAA
jgi:uncharacterized protein YciI